MSIDEYLYKRHQRVWFYKYNMFSVPEKANSRFNLKVLEPVYIESEQPSLCKKKKVVGRLKVNIFFK